MLTISNAKAITKDNAWNTVMPTPPQKEEPTIRNLYPTILQKFLFTYIYFAILWNLREYLVKHTKKALQMQSLWHI